MKKTVLLLATFVLAFIPLAGSVDAEATQTLSGEFVWNQRGAKGDLEAVFSAAGEGAWTVSFRFTFRGKEHVYAGTAEGSLSEGPLGGQVVNESGKRTFTFNGQFDGGTFRGTHAEVADGEAEETGTLTLAN